MFFINIGWIPGVLVVLVFSLERLRSLVASLLVFLPLSAVWLFPRPYTIDCCNRVWAFFLPFFFVFSWTLCGDSASAFVCSLAYFIFYCTFGYARIYIYKHVCLFSRAEFSDAVEQTFELFGWCSWRKQALLGGRDGFLFSAACSLMDSCGE